MSTLQEIAVTLAARWTAPKAETFEEYRTRVCRDWLQALIGRHDGNIADAAREAGKNRTDFYKVLRRHGITFKSPRSHRGNWGDEAS